jgi:molecular chaperone HtpG
MAQRIGRLGSLVTGPSPSSCAQAKERLPIPFRARLIREWQNCRIEVTVLDKGFDVLLLTEDVDEFCLQILHSYPRKDAEGKDGTVEFKNVNSGDLGLESEEEKKAAEDATAENKALFDAMKDALNGKVKEVKVSTRLKDHPVCLSADGPLSIEMEKVLSKQPGSEGVKSDKVLELNVNHPVFAALKAAQEAGDTEKLNKYSALLYAQAQLIEGLPVDDPAAYAEAVCSLMK